MKCFNHVDLDAVATCQVCGKGLCHDCAAKYTPCMCDSCAAAQVQLAEESEINYEKAAKAEYKARRKYEKKEAGRYLSEQWRANTAIGFVAAAIGTFIFWKFAMKSPALTESSTLFTLALMAVSFFGLPFGWRFLNYLESLLPALFCSVILAIVLFFVKFFIAWAIGFPVFLVMLLIYIIKRIAVAASR